MSKLRLVVSSVSILYFRLSVRPSHSHVQIWHKCPQLIQLEYDCGQTCVNCNLNDWRRHTTIQTNLWILFIHQDKELVQIKTRGQCTHVFNLQPKRMEITVVVLLLTDCNST